MANIFEGLGKGLENATNNVKNKTGDIIDSGARIISDVASETSKITDNVVKEGAHLLDEAGKSANNLANETGKVTKGAINAVGGIDMFHSKLRKQAIEGYNSTVERYEKVATDLEQNTGLLFEMRKNAVDLVREVEAHINVLANTPKEFTVNLKKIEVELADFENKTEEIKKAEAEAKIAAGGSGTGATLSALGLAVATMGPTAAMGIATTFGVASTGTAISTLSGAAATNAALAWLGGGALAAGGGGMSAGTGLLVLAGPVGWTIAGVAGAAAIGSGIFASFKNKETAEKLVGERENLETIIRNFNIMNAEVTALSETTKIQVKGVRKGNDSLTGSDYSEFTKDEKLQAGMLVNNTLTLAQLINKELKLND